MHVCRSAAAAERKQRRHREVQSSGCCSHGTARGREGEGRVSYRIGYSNLGFGQGRGRDLIPRSAHLALLLPPQLSLLSKNVSASFTFLASFFLPLVHSRFPSLPFVLVVFFPGKHHTPLCRPSCSFKRWIRVPRPHLATPKRCGRAKNKDCDMFCSHLFTCEVTRPAV